jgi:hypothetical protein
MSRLKTSLQVYDLDLSREEAPQVVARAILWAGDGFAGYYESSAGNIRRKSDTVVSTCSYWVDVYLYLRCFTTVYIPI